MLVKSLHCTRVETLQWKREVKKWEIFECSKSVYNGLKTCYKNSFEFLDLYVLSKKKCKINWIEYKKNEVIKVNEKKFNNLKSFYKNSFTFIDNAELFEKYIWKKQEKNENDIKKDLKEKILKIVKWNESLNLEIEEIKKEIKNLNKEKLQEYLNTILKIDWDEIKDTKTEEIIKNEDKTSNENKENDIVEAESEKEAKNEEKDTKTEEIIKKD